MGPCFKSYLSYKFDWLETISDQAKKDEFGRSSCLETLRNLFCALPKATVSESLEVLQPTLLKMGNILLKNSVIFAGDFNVSDINWPNLESSTYLSSPSEKLLEIVYEHKTTCRVSNRTSRQHA